MVVYDWSMTKILGEPADWPTTSRKLFVHATSLSPSAKAFESTRPLITLCNFSPFNPYLITDPLDFGPSPAREHRKPPSPPVQARCNLTPVHPDTLPAMPNIEGHHGVATWSQKPDYKTYKSPYGPNYTVRPNFHGIALNRAMKFGITAGSFGVVGAVFVLQFFADVPKVRTDIMQKLPVVGDYFIRDIPPSDNPF